MSRLFFYGFVCLLILNPTGTNAQPKSVPLHGQIIDVDTKQIIPARIYIQRDDGTWYYPKSVSPSGSAILYRKQRGSIPSIEMHTTLSAHPFVVNLPPGTYNMTVERGHEYHPVTKKITIKVKPVDITIPLQRWSNIAKRGWYSGDTHVHRTLEELPNVMLAEDLNVALPLTYWVTQAYASPRTSAKSSPKDVPSKLIQVDKTHVIYPRNTEYEIFTVGKKRHTLGAIFVLNHQKVFEKGVPPVGPVAKQARQEGALLELDKHNWPWSMMLVPMMKVDLYELSNNHVWRTHFGFPQFGIQPPKFMKVETDLQGMTERGWLDFTFQNYYVLLNCGFRLRPTAGTASGVHPVPLGFGRVYVHCPKGFTYQHWIKGLNQGRSFVTTGPMLFTEVNGESTGHTFQQTEKKVNYHIKGEALSARPLDRIEIVVNGQVIETVKPTNRKTESGGYQSPIDAKVSVDSSSWIVTRCFESRVDKRIRFAHTAPVHVDVKGKPLRPRQEEIGYLIERIEEELKRHENVLPESALQEYRQALAIYQKIAKSAVKR